MSLRSVDRTLIARKKPVVLAALFLAAASLTAIISSYGGAVSVTSTPLAVGYWLATSNGVVAADGSVSSFESTGDGSLMPPVVGMALTPDAKGYWLADADGRLSTFGDAHYYGSAAGTPLAGSVVSVAATADGKGYWLIGANGGVLAFGDARSYGSTSSTHLDAPVVGMAVAAQRPWVLAGSSRWGCLRVRQRWVLWICQTAAHGFARRRHGANLGWRGLLGGDGRGEGRSLWRCCLLWLSFSAHHVPHCRGGDHTGW